MLGESPRGSAHHSGTALLGMAPTSTAQRWSSSHHNPLLQRNTEHASAACSETHQGGNPPQEQGGDCKGRAQQAILLLFLNTLM